MSMREFINFVFPTNIVGTRTKIAFSGAILEIITAIASSIFNFSITGVVLFIIFASVSFVFARMI